LARWFDTHSMAERQVILLGRNWRVHWLNPMLLLLLLLFI